MFERATKKLGLDQALFYGADFKQVQLDDYSSTKNYTGRKLNKNEMELLLKRGSLGLLQQQEEGIDAT